MRTLPLAEAKATLSKLVSDLAASGDEVTITRNGRAAAVLISADSFREQAKMRSYAPNSLTASEDRDFLAGTPWHKHVPARVERIAQR